MHRMNIDGTLFVPGTNPVYYFDKTINGDGILAIGLLYSMQMR